LSIVSKARVVLRNFAEKVLDVDNTVVPRSQLVLFEDYLEKHRFNTDVTELDDLVKVLKNKHLVDSICVSNSVGTMLASTNGTEISQSVMGTALFNYISSELPKSEAVLIKAKDWFMLLPYKDKIYIIKSPANLSTIELKAIAKEVEEFLDKKRHTSN